MAKIISKTEVTKKISQTEELEILSEEIDRNESSSAKQSKLSKFSSAVQKQVKDERDVILISIKVK